MHAGISNNKFNQKMILRKKYQMSQNIKYLVNLFKKKVALNSLKSLESKIKECIGKNL